LQVLEKDFSKVRPPCDIGWLTKCPMPLLDKVGKVAVTSLTVKKIRQMLLRREEKRKVR
jgi:hypothetical protein